MIFRIITLSLLILSSINASAVKLELIELCEGLSPSVYRNPPDTSKVALIKVCIPTEEAFFEGQVISSRKVEKEGNHNNMFWIVVAEGTDKLTVHCEGYEPLEATFPPLKSLFTYYMEIAPEGGKQTSTPDQR